jgi:hypothetical protein
MRPIAQEATVIMVRDGPILPRLRTWRGMAAVAMLLTALVLLPMGYALYWRHGGIEAEIAR